MDTSMNNEKDLKKFHLDHGFATRCLHAGEHVGQPQHVTHVGAIYQSSTFIFENAEQGAAIFAGQEPGYMYTRLGNPTVVALEAKIAALEAGDLKRQNPSIQVASLAFTTGMAAISSTILAVLEQGDTFLLGKAVYGATQHMSQHVLTRYGIKTIEVDTSNLAELDQVIKANPKAKAILFETPTNPTLDISDIPAVIKTVRSVNPAIRVLIDNTFATPYLQRPLEMGADAVLHSTTKYISGHGVIVGGALVTTDPAIRDKALLMAKDLGGTPSPFDAWLVNMGLKTLPARMDKHCANAMAVANYLAEHKKVAKVWYPGLKNHQGHDIAKRQMKDFGGMVSFELKGGFDAGKNLMNNIEVFSLAVSLGCVDSLISHPASMTHACMAKHIRESAGITDGLVRASIGIEDIDDIITALDKGLARA